MSKEETTSPEEYEPYDPESQNQPLIDPTMRQQTGMYQPAYGPVYQPYQQGNMNNPYHQQPPLNPQFYPHPEMNQEYYQEPQMNQQHEMNQTNQMNQYHKDLENPSKFNSSQSHGDQDLGEKFKTHKFNDVWASVLFIAHLVVLFVLTLKFKSNSSDYHPDDNKTYSAKFIWITFSISILSAVIGSWIWIQLMKKYAKGLLKFTLLSGILFIGILAIAMFVLGSIVGGIIFLVFFVISILVYRAWARRIPFSALLLTFVTRTLQKYPAMITIAFLFGVILQILWTIAWFYVAILTYNLNNGYWAIYVVFSYFWTSTVIKNGIHTTSSGTYASYYFLKGDMPKDPTLKSLKRAFTFSFGSICLGSLIVAVIKTLRWIARSGHKNRNDCVRCLCIYCLNFLDWLVQFFNQFAYGYISIYGMNFFQASKKTFHLFKERGLTALINDDLIGGVVNLAAISTGIIAAIITGILTFIHYNHDKIWIGFSLVSLLIAVFISFIILETIISGVTTFFICFAEAPEVIQELDPELSQKLHSTYNFNF
ncbi:protein pns1 [Anaeramoeba ignava]|uniref:Choline transporter-like protein n=1 Tax=Anaeramoeba ignava TaxID=1746090 RepID=A0A9Q0RFI3_ANAIG|nr:protein pns1 [Anaeramoeba ignava]